MKIKIILLYFFISIVTSILLYAQTGRIRFDHISIENGLSQSVVTCIYKDKEGFMWFGTQDGLNKYDGYKFTVYKSVPFDSTSLSDNWIQAITEGENGHLWIGTYSGGLFDMDKENETFINYRNIPGNKNSLINNRVWTLWTDKSGSIWIGTSGGLDKFNIQKKNFTHFKNMKNKTGSKNGVAVNSIYEDKNGIIWVGTWGSGLMSYDKEKNIFTIYNFNKEKKSGFNYVKTIYPLDNDLWLGTSFGLLRFDKVNKDFKYYPFSGNKSYSIQNSVLSINKDSDGSLWVGTHNNGLYKVDINTGQFSEYIKDVSDPHSISDNWISAVYKDSENIIWLGTGKGINRILPYSKYFLHFGNKPGDPNSLSADEVNSIFEDHNGIIWVGTWGGGLNRFDITKKTFKCYMYSSAVNKNKSNDIVWSVFEDSDNKLWVGTYSGLKVFDRETDKFKDPPFETGLIRNNNISDVFQDSFGYLWIGTWGGGLYKYDKIKNKMTAYISDASDSSSISNNLISVIYEDNKNNLWIGTNAGGLNLYNYKENKFYHFLYNPKNTNSLSNNNVTSLYRDRHNRLWIGTWGGGLNMLDLKTNSFKHYTETEGLSNNIIYGILADENNYLWISTSNGLSRFNMSSRSFIIYDDKDGLGNNQFSQGYLKCRNGEMMFGGINGITVFNPDSVSVNKKIPKVVFTSFMVFNKEHKLITLKNGNKEIILNYDEHDFSIEFSALDFVRPDKNHYAYKLEGYDRNWIYSNHRRKVYYTNMEPGVYTFKVKASNSDNIWTDKASLLTIKIIPPFWKTWPFMIVVLLAVLSLIYLIHRYRLEQLLKFERIRNTIAVDLHDDIGASLTRISLFSHAALRSLSKLHLNKNTNVPVEQVESLLAEIDENSRELISSMSDIVWAVNPKNDSFDKISIRMKDYTAKVFEANEIDYEIFIDPALSSLVLPMDLRRNIFMIYKEGIANILRHANASQVVIKLFREKEDIIISIHDDGKGFSVDGVNSGNGLKNINERAASFKGFSEIISEPGRGTTLTVILKLP